MDDDDDCGDAGIDMKKLDTHNKFSISRHNLPNASDFKKTQAAVVRAGLMWFSYKCWTLAPPAGRLWCSRPST